MRIKSAAVVAGFVHRGGRLDGTSHGVRSGSVLARRLDERRCDFPGAPRRAGVAQQPGDRGAPRARVLAAQRPRRQRVLRPASCREHVGAKRGLPRPGAPSSRGGRARDPVAGFPGRPPRGRRRASRAMARRESDRSRHGLRRRDRARRALARCRSVWPPSRHRPQATDDKTGCRAPGRNRRSDPRSDESLRRSEGSSSIGMPQILKRGSGASSPRRPSRRFACGRSGSSSIGALGGGFLPLPARGIERNAADNGLELDRFDDAGKGLGQTGVGRQSPARTDAIASGSRRSRGRLAAAQVELVGARIDETRGGARARPASAAASPAALRPPPRRPAPAPRRCPSTSRVYWLDQIAVPSDGSISSSDTLIVIAGRRTEPVSTTRRAELARDVARRAAADTGASPIGRSPSARASGRAASIRSSARPSAK